ncbi:nucleoside-diphosphate sugar epimerase/dehydratase [Marinilactibacillus kalidii]|uniref:nucleoside-diphosphate sugar epimerase/dehydratase n=1 Tax=Marinilactibacillus kalidii TaxID=2820274 RepID=UPI001ABDC285|nr:nucleoside-diphosphate sugar epimerase/dehydratase [Marinilactibacillus kalidii]
MNRKLKKKILIIYDLLSILISSTLSYLFLIPFVLLPNIEFWLSVLLSSLTYYVIGWYLHFFSKINRYTSLKETLVHISGVFVTFLLTAIILLPWFGELSLRHLTLTCIFSCISIPGSRIMWRIYQERSQKVKSEAIDDNVSKIRTLVIGAGDGGSLFIKSLQRHSNGIELIGVVDDDPAKQGVYLYGTPLLGMVKDIPNIVKSLKVQQITIAIPTLLPDELDRIVEICSQTAAKVNRMPSIEEVVQGKLEVNNFRNIDIADLLGRDEVELDIGHVASLITGKVVLVTGAGGSIGSEICRQLIRFSPKKIILLGHGENSIYNIHKEVTNAKDTMTEVVPVIADIQDYNRMLEIMSYHKPNRVYHAAAHKHVPLMEYNPKEAIKNNIIGTKNLATAARMSSVESFIMISTDKAVNPPNIMGASKRVAEMIVTSMNAIGKTKFAAVRFGNVLGSRGSVIPLFKEQIENGGPLTVTDFRMTRYFMTIPEASKLVIQAGALAEGGEIFILDMGEPVKIIDLAKKVIKLSGNNENDIKIIESGIRPGEKLYEELLMVNEQLEQQVYDKIFVGKVNRISFDSVMNWVNKLEYLDDSDLKKELIRFANQKNNTEMTNTIDEEGETNVSENVQKIH